MVWYLYLSETPVSHFDTALPVTQIFSASSFWVSSAFSLSLLTVFPVMYESIIILLSLSDYKSVLTENQSTHRGTKARIKKCRLLSIVKRPVLLLELIFFRPVGISVFVLFVIAQKLAAFVAQRHHINILVLLFVVKGENTV